MTHDEGGAGTMADNKNWGYVRVSTREQSCERQINEIESYAAANSLKIDRIFEEKASGKNFDERPIWQSLKLTTMRTGDLLVITEIDRLGRNYDQIKDEYREIEKLGVDIVVLENDLLSTKGKSDLERKLISDIVFSLLSYVSEKERQKLRSRQAEGIAIARAAGKYRGRKPVSVPADEFERVYTQWKNKEITAVKGMELLGVKRDVFYRLVREWEEKSQE
jgi:DNA invertase Pin-like site-specific DNA recombinase